MNTTVYTLGYASITPEEVKRIAETLDAVVFDIRYSPWSRVPGFTARNLHLLLGDRYVPARFFGNERYRENAPVKIADFAAGVAAVERSERPVILMCACRDYLSCHRRLLGDTLEAMGFEVTEIGGAPQRTLFEEGGGGC